jgi:hypothetical protein
MLANFMSLARRLTARYIGRATTMNKTAHRSKPTLKGGAGKKLCKVNVRELFSTLAALAAPVN